MVGACDYSTYPGNYNNSVEWRGPNNEFKVLAQVGDIIPEITILASGWLEIRYRKYDPTNYDKYELVIITVKDLDAAPVSTSQRKPK